MLYRLRKWSFSKITLWQTPLLFMKKTSSNAPPILSKCTCSFFTVITFFLFLVSCNFTCSQGFQIPTLIFFYPQWQYASYGCNRKWKSRSVPFFAGKWQQSQLVQQQVMIPRSSASSHFNSQCFGSFFQNFSFRILPSHPDAFFCRRALLPMD